MSRNFFFSKYLKYKRRYLKLKLEGDELLPEISFPNDYETVKSKLVGESVFKRHFDLIWKSVLTPIVDTCEYIKDRYYIVYRYQEDRFDRVQGRDIQKPCGLRLSVKKEIISKDATDIYLIFYISREGMETDHFVFQMYVYGDRDPILMTVYNNDEVLYRRYREDDDDMTKSVVNATKYWMSFFLGPPIFNLSFVEGEGGGRFGNTMFTIGRWICYLVKQKQRIGSDFIIGISFMARKGKFYGSLSFEEDMSDFFTGKLNYDLLPSDFMTTVSQSSQYNFLDIKTIKEDGVHRERMEKYGASPVVFNEEVTIVNNIPRSLITHFCYSYVETKNAALVNLKIPHTDVALHFRGSDFCITDENWRNAHFFVLHFRYYLAALDKLKTRNYNLVTGETTLSDPKRVTIFATPMDKYIVLMMIEYLKHFFPQTEFLTEQEYIENHISGVKINGPLELILLISKFSGIVLSNSSFSFWCGYLSSSNSKVVAWFSRNVYDDRWVTSFGRFIDPSGKKCHLMTKAYIFALKYLDQFFHNWIDVDLDPSYSCDKYLQPCHYLWWGDDPKNCGINHLTLFYILYHVWHGLELGETVDAAKTLNLNPSEITLVARIIAEAQSDEPLKPFSHPDEEHNSMTMNDFLAKLKIIRKNRDRSDLVDFVDQLHFTAYTRC